MNELLLGLLGAMLATNQVAQISNVVAQTTGIRLPVTDPNDPVEREYRKLLEDDDAATTEVDRWIQENQAEIAKGKLGSATLNLRIDERARKVTDAYDDFLLRHPNHVQARLAYGSFLNEIGHADEAIEQLEKAREIDPRNPATWNNLADLYTHFGPATNVFVYLGKAIELSPKEGLYYRNLATAVFVYRPDAMEYYHLPDDQAVLQRSLELYRQARRLDPTNFPLATDLAQVYYFLHPAPSKDPLTAEANKLKFLEEALQAWRDAEKIASDEVERQGVYIHMARVCRTHGRLAEARAYLKKVDRPEFEQLKRRVERSIDSREPEQPLDASPERRN